MAKGTDDPEGRLLKVEPALEDARMGVFCPRSRATVPFADCVGCPHCSGIVVDVTEQGSLVRCTAEGPEADWGALAGARVRDLMTRPARTVAPDDDIESVVSLFLEAGISGAPVVDERGRVIGMISKTDLVREGAERRSRAPGEGGRNERLEDALPIDGLPVRAVMTPLAFVLDEDAPLPVACALMAYEGIHRAPVCAASGEVVGVLSALDVLGFIAKVAGLPR